MELYLFILFYDNLKGNIKHEELDLLSNSTNINNINMEVIRNNRDILIDGRASYFTDLIKTAVKLSAEIAKETNKQVINMKSMLITETITIMTASWRNTLPFNLFVSQGAHEFAKNLGIDDLRNYDYSLKFGMDEIIKKIEDPTFLSVATNLNDQDLAKLNKALNKEDKALNSNVMLHWDHSYTGKMFTNDVTTLINTLSESNASDEAISTAVKALIEKQSITWLLKTEVYSLANNDYKELRQPDWETAYKNSGIELSDGSKEDYEMAFGKEW